MGEAVTPYLSIIMGVGGNLSDDLLCRLRESIRKIQSFEWIRQSYTPMEFVVVEWNVSLRDTGKVEAAIENSLCPIRIIHTPRELHEQVPNPHGFRYFEWYPKNIGIRRAHGEFVLSCNPDGLWSDALAEFISRRELKHGHFYRVNRHDTQEVENAIGRKETKVFRICYPTGGHSPDETEEQIRTPCSPRACPWSEDMLHYSAAGDFTLMARDDWFMIHGNPEQPYNDTVDGQTIWLAHTKGLKQVLLPYPLYHPDHPRSLNKGSDGKHAGPEWDDNKPFTQENGPDWGFADMTFEETVL